jgi:hypothetical protein
MYSFLKYLPPSPESTEGNPITLYSTRSSLSYPVVSTDMSFPCSDFLGITYSEIGAKSSNVSVAGAGEASLVRDTERDRASSPEEVDVMRFSGT